MDLKAITEHPSYPFAHFREDDAQFALLEAYWHGLGLEVLGPDVWPQISILSKTDQDQDEWGNPVMLDFWLPHLRRGAKVELLENTEGLVACRDSEDKLNCFASITVYTKWRAIMGPEDAIEQICLRADMSAVARTAVIELLSAFLVQRHSAEQIEAQFDAFCERTGEGLSRAFLRARGGAQVQD